MKAKTRPRPLWPFYVLVILLWIALALAPAHAATCAGVADALARLATTYREAVLWQGDTPQGERLLITATPDGTTWTAIVQPAPGQACFIAAGTVWQIGADAPPAGKEG